MKKNHFWTIHLDYSIIGIGCTYMIGILSVYVAVSHDYPKWCGPFWGSNWQGGVGMYHLPDCDDFSTKFLLENHSLSLPTRLGLDGSSSCFYNPNLVASTGAKNWVAYGNITLFQPSEFMKIPFLGQLGSGFKIAMRDLSIRGAGISLELLVSSIQLVFEMYSQLLRKKLLLNKAKTSPEQSNARVNLQIDAYLPNELYFRSTSEN